MPVLILELVPELGMKLREEELRKYIDTST